MEKKLYKVYSARLNYSEMNHFIVEIPAYTIEEVKSRLRMEYNKNPYYTVIIDETDGANIIEYNKFMNVCKAY